MIETEQRLPRGVQAKPRAMHVMQLSPAY